jgi:uncharacterized membrane protein
VTFHPFGRRDDDPIDDEPDTILGISFDDVFRAQEFLTAMSGMQHRGTLQLVDAVMVVKDEAGQTRVRETVDLQPGRAAVSGAVWTGLLGLLVGGPVGWIAGLGLGAGAGAIAAKVVDVGVPDEWVAWFREAVDPHTFTVVVLARDVHLDALVEETGRFHGARLVYANLRPFTIERIEAALGETGGSDVLTTDEPDPSWPAPDASGPPARPED